jgi:hypothetical protein
MLTWLLFYCSTYYITLSDIVVSAALCLGRDRKRSPLLLNTFRLPPPPPLGRLLDFSQTNKAALWSGFKYRRLALNGDKLRQRYLIFAFHNTRECVGKDSFYIYSTSFFSLLTLWSIGLISQFLDYLQEVGHLGRVISSSQGLYLNTGQHKHRINTYTYQISMPCVGF